MKYTLLTFLLIFLSTFYSSGQNASDSTEIIKTYKKNIVEGRVIKNVGGGLMIAGLVTSIITFPFWVSEGVSNTEQGSATTIMEVAVITTLIAIPITFLGEIQQKSNERKLARYRLSLQTMGNTPIIGIKYRF